MAKRKDVVPDGKYKAVQKGFDQITREQLYELVDKYLFNKRAIAKSLSCCVRILETLLHKHGITETEWRLDYGTRKAVMYDDLLEKKAKMGDTAAIIYGHKVFAGGVAGFREKQEQAVEVKGINTIVVNSEETKENIEKLKDL